MPKNPYFDENFGSSTEQALFEDLAEEFIQIHGQTMYYCPRTLNNFNRMLGADDVSSYESAHPIVTYIKDSGGFMGEGSIITKLSNYEIRDQITFSISTKEWAREIAAETEIIRPREADLIYFPLNRKLFKIVFVDYKPVFYQAGALQWWDVKCELFEYSQEKLTTGIADIDALQLNRSINILDHALLDENGDYLVDENGDILVVPEFDYEAREVFSDNAQIDEEVPEFIDFSEENPFSENLS